MVHTLRPFQENAYRSLVENAHTVLVAPTGSGKSLIFQTYLRNFAHSTRAIFISPLNALARQHERNFNELGLKVTQGVGKEGSGPPAQSGVWILNPEKLFLKYREAAKAWKPNLLIVDEAHCIWEWGQSFRPQFKELPAAILEFKIAKSYWCTATLPSAALEGIRAGLPSAPSVLGRFSIPAMLNVIRLKVPPHARIEVLRSLLSSNSLVSGIIFVSTRNTSDRILQYLRFWNIEAVAYHAGMSEEERMALERRIADHSSSRAPIWIVATSAFGMGMNYSFLKVCILFEPSFNLLALAQAVGRVGRGNDLAHAYVLWHENDFVRHSWLVEHSPRNRTRYAEVKEWCETSFCHRAHLEKYFNEESISGKVKECEIF